MVTFHAFAKAYGRAYISCSARRVTVAGVDLDAVPQACCRPAQEAALRRCCRSCW